jgi:flagellar assembly protein FliH
MAAVLGAEAVSIQRWVLPDIGRTAMAKRAANAANAPNVQELAAVKAQARTEGFTAGHAEGLAAAQTEIRGQRAQLEALFEAAARPLQVLGGQTEQALASLAMLVARRVLASELRLAPELVLRAVQQAVAAVPAAEHGLRVHVHPEDLPLLQAAATADSHWECVADPQLARGDCVVESARSHLDARVETRLAAVIDAVLGEPSGEPEASA